MTLISRVKESPIYEGAVVGLEWSFALACFVVGMLGYIVTKIALLFFNASCRLGKGESTVGDGANGFELALLGFTLAFARHGIGVETPKGSTSAQEQELSDVALREKRVYTESTPLVTSEEVAYINEVSRESVTEQPGDIFGEKPNQSGYQADEPKEVPQT